MTSSFVVTILCQLEDVSETSHHYDSCKILYKILYKFFLRYTMKAAEPSAMQACSFTCPKGLTRCVAAYSTWKLAMDLKPFRKSRTGMRFLPASWRSRTSSHSSVAATKRRDFSTSNVPGATEHVRPVFCVLKILTSTGAAETVVSGFRTRVVQAVGIGERPRTKLIPINSTGFFKKFRSKL